MGMAKVKRKPVLICCGVLLALIVVLAVVFVALYFTVFRPRSPRVVATVVGTEVHINPGWATFNLTLRVEVAVDNPNYASFRYGDVLTLVRYHGVDVGQSVVPAGEIGARAAKTVGATVEVDAAAVTASEYFWPEFAVGVLPFETATAVAGKAVVLGTFKVSARSEVVCEVTVKIFTSNVTSQCTSTVHVG